MDRPETSLDNRNAMVCVVNAVETLSIAATFEQPLCPTGVTFLVLHRAIHLSFVRLTFDGLMNLNVNANRSNIAYKGKRQL